jgi:quercetin dioxygenase-like cupin family protein
MKRLATGLSLTLAGSIAAGALGVQSLHAQEKKKEEYVSTAEIKTLVQKPLPEMEGKQITILDVTAQPGWTGGRHYHSGPVFVVVKEGAFTIEVDGKPQHTIKAGEVYEEPIGTPMLAKNLNTAEPTKFLVIQVSNAGEPLMYKSE